MEGFVADCGRDFAPGQTTGARSGIPQTVGFLLASYAFSYPQVLRETPRLVKWKQPVWSFIGQ